MGGKLESGRAGHLAKVTQPIQNQTEDSGPCLHSSGNQANVACLLGEATG